MTAALAILTIVFAALSLYSNVRYRRAARKLQAHVEYVRERSRRQIDERDDALRIITARYKALLEQSCAKIEPVFTVRQQGQKHWLN